MRLDPEARALDESCLVFFLGVLIGKDQFGRGSLILLSYSDGQNISDENLVLLVEDAEIDIYLNSYALP